jgi:hypothetical protein
MCGPRLAAPAHADGDHQWGVAGLARDLGGRALSEQQLDESRRPRLRREAHLGQRVLCV